MHYIHVRIRAVYKCIPYSGLFPWGDKFRYFRGQPRSHEIFHQPIFGHVSMCGYLHHKYWNRQIISGGHLGPFMKVYTYNNNSLYGMCTILCTVHAFVNTAVFSALFLFEVVNCMH